ncbi:MAG TPA: CBS domain-containing protein [Actinomycetota bacterium]|jgi:Mg/Co/Ni transporter MgtE|nr:CBS domain-containing protein [Actinomycetota bacterium]
MSPRAAWRLEALGFTDVADYAGGKADWAAMGLPTEGSEAERQRLGDLARDDLPTFGLSDSVGEIRNGLEREGWATGVVVNDERIVLGRVYASKLEEASADASAREVMTEGPSTFRPNVPAGEMLRFARRHELDTALVTTSEGRLVGFVLTEDLE